MRSYTPLIPTHIFQPRFGFLDAAKLQKALEYAKHIDVYKLAVRTLIWVSIVDACVLPILFVKIYYYPSLRAVEVTRYAEAALSATPGPATTDLLAAFGRNGLVTHPAMEISRPHFSVQGRIITVADDNIQVFEYQNSTAAQADYAAFVKKNSKSYTHLYIKDNLIALYIGDKPTIIGPLDSIFNNK
ncbi:MAG: hypothetical protein V4524_03545 [Patescibacteria group bacterium]